MASYEIGAKRDEILQVGNDNAIASWVRRVRGFSRRRK